MAKATGKTVMLKMYRAQGKMGLWWFFKRRSTRLATRPDYPTGTLNGVPVDIAGVWEDGTVAVSVDYTLLRFPRSEVTVTDWKGLDANGQAIFYSVGE